ncbi:MAG: hypothetical protein WAW15_01625 [Minisyncoccales bacterium]
MVGDFMMKKALRLNKFLYAVFFERKTGRVLLIKSGLKVGLPGGQVSWEDISKSSDERWKRDFLIKKIPTQTGLAAYFIEQETQPIPATYETYDFGREQEFSAVIVGEIDSCQVVSKDARFCSIDQLKRLIKKGKIDRCQELLILRAFVSRDCPGKNLRLAAIKLLKEKHQ